MVSFKIINHLKLIIIKYHMNCRPEANKKPLKQYITNAEACGGKKPQDVLIHLTISFNFSPEVEMTTLSRVTY